MHHANALASSGAISGYSRLTEVVQYGNDGTGTVSMEVESDILMGSPAGFVFPGESIAGAVHRTGQGLTRRGTSSVSTVAGSLRVRTAGEAWVDTPAKRYMPKCGDSIIAVVEDKGGDNYLLNAFGACPVLMNRLAFDGATKRNKPELNRGDVIYCRVVVSNPDSDVVVTCTAPSGPKKDWSTGEAVYGDLRGGVVIHVPMDYARRLLQPDNVLLHALSRYFCFEVAIGMNGAVWIRASTGRAVELIVIRNAVISAETLDSAQVIALVDELAKLSATNS